MRRQGDEALEGSPLEILRELTGAMLERGVGGRGLASVVRDDPGWDNMECTRRHVALMWQELNEAVTAETGAALTRRLTDWDETWNPIIVVGEPDDFDEKWPADEPYGWLPLGKAHKREAGWDFPPSEESGTWIGWWEPQTAWGTEGGHNVTGLLSAFIIVKNGDLKFAHTVTRRRRTGIASKLVAHAAANHGLAVARGPFTPDGEAFARATDLLDH